MIHPKRSGLSLNVWPVIAVWSYLLNPFLTNTLCRFPSCQHPDLTHIAITGSLGECENIVISKNNPFCFTLIKYSKLNENYF